ncbi:MAG: type II toxin-antitoxin system MqsA family antitoxin [Deltaproteobacteria bacterium]|nr:type II toxin-antitoxin system MqsA family antitoxin [Deltaproteobacteria bacterium]
MKTPSCSSCGYKKMKHETEHTEVVTVAGLTEVVTGLSGWFCPECNDGWLDEASSKQYGLIGDELVRQHREQIKNDVRRIRRKLGLTQKQAANVFGGGINAFSKYERGEVEPGLSTLKLLRLLDRHPKLLVEIDGGT